MLRAVFSLSLGLMVVLTISGCRDTSRKLGMPRAQIRHLNPDELCKSNSKTQAVVVFGPNRTIYVSAQHGVDPENRVIGAGDLRKQTEAALKNLEYALASGGAGLQHLVKCTIYLVQGQPSEPCLEVLQNAWSESIKPPAVTLIYVAALSQPEFLVAIEATAVIPQD